MRFPQTFRQTKNRAMLASRNCDADEINAFIMKRFPSGEHGYQSINPVLVDDGPHYLMEFLNTVSVRNAASSTKTESWLSNHNAAELTLTTVSAMERGSSVTPCRHSSTLRLLAQLASANGYLSRASSRRLPMLAFRSHTHQR